MYQSVEAGFGARANRVARTTCLLAFATQYNGSPHACEHSRSPPTAGSSSSSRRRSADAGARSPDRRARPRARGGAQPSRSVRRRRAAGRHDHAAWILGADGAGIDRRRRRRACAGSRSAIACIINPGISDRTCEYCLAGEQPLCPRFRLLGEHLPGTMAEYVVVPAANVRVIPPRRSPGRHAAAFTLATLTAWRMIVTRARVQPGETVLIWGIGGGVALAALQIAKRLGARVWAISASDEKLARAARARRRRDASIIAPVDVARAIRDAHGQARRGRRRRQRRRGDVGAVAAARSAAAAGS